MSLFAPLWRALVRASLRCSLLFAPIGFQTQQAGSVSRGIDVCVVAILAQRLAGLCLNFVKTLSLSAGKAMVLRMVVALDDPYDRVSEDDGVAAPGANEIGVTTSDDVLRAQLQGVALGTSRAVMAQEQVNRAAAPAAASAPAAAPAQFHSARPLLQSYGVHGYALEFLVIRSYDRAVLLAELVEQVGPEQLSRIVGIEAAVLSACATGVRESFGIAAQFADKGRYAPPQVGGAHALLHMTFHERVRRSRPSGWSWAELAASGAPMSAASLAGVAADVFDESGQLSAYNAPSERFAVAGATAVHRLSFEVRCAKSGCSLLVPRLGTDNAAPRFDEPPSKRLRRARVSAPGLQDPRDTGWRFRGHIEAELQIRISARSFCRSWRSYRSGWLAWYAFMAVYHPLEAHFPIVLPRLAAFAAHFRNETSFATYVAWIRSGQALLCIEDGLGKRFCEALMRGIRSTWVPGSKVPTL